MAGTVLVSPGAAVTTGVLRGDRKIRAAEEAADGDKGGGATL